MGKVWTMTSGTATSGPTEKGTEMDGTWSMRHLGQKRAPKMRTAGLRGVENGVAGSPESLDMCLRQVLHERDGEVEWMSFGKPNSPWKLRNPGQISRGAAGLPGGAMIS